MGRCWNSFDSNFGMVIFKSLNLIKVIGLGLIILGGNAGKMFLENKNEISVNLENLKDASGQTADCKFSGITAGIHCRADQIFLKHIFQERIFLPRPFILSLIPQI